MRKYLIPLLIAVGIGLVGWVGYDYSRSGEQIAAFNLEGGEGSTDLIKLDPSMNPLRAILTVSYEIELLKGTSAAFDYDILMTGPGGVEVFAAQGQQRDKRDDNTPEYATKSSELVIKTFAVPVPGEYLLDWRIAPVEAKILGQSISLRRNVEPFRVAFLIPGVLSLALGFFLLIRSKRKRR